MTITKIRKAIDIQGYVTIYTDCGPQKVTEIRGADTDGSWITDIMTSDLMGYIRIKKTKKQIVAQAERIIANEAAIRAKREQDGRRAMARMTGQDG